MPVKRQTAGPSTEQKRTRFADSPPAGRSRQSGSASLEPEDDLLEEDLPENAQKAKAKTRRQLRDQDGYGSDSSNDEESVVPSRRAGAKGDAEDDDVDMFADDADEKAKEKDKGKGKEKGKEYMDLEDFEGQEFGKTTGEGYDSDDQREKRKQGLDGDFGIEITPFNMKNEMEEGRFTADGESYVQNDKDPNEKHDVWLEDVDEDEIAKARRAHEEREALEKKREEQEDDLANDKKRQDELMRLAVDLMQRGETVLEALQRLGKEAEDKRKKEEGGKKKSWAERQKERKAALQADAAQDDSYRTSNPFTNMSNIVATLTNTAQLDVYSLSRESLQRMLPPPPQPANGHSAPPAPPVDNRQFQYRFSMAYVRSLPESQRPVEREIFGPFSVTQLRQWRGTGFFGGPECQNVELKKVGDEGTWGSWADVVG